MTSSDDKGVVLLRGETSHEKAKFSNYNFCNNCHDYEWTYILSKTPLTTLLQAVNYGYKLSNAADFSSLFSNFTF